MSCHSASVRSEVYRIRSVLRECIYIVQTKIADFIDAFWVFKQALRKCASLTQHYRVPQVPPSDRPTRGKVQVPHDRDVRPPARQISAQCFKSGSGIVQVLTKI